MDTAELCQAKFILNALKDGWTVKMKTHGELEFTKDRESHMTELDYSRKFLEKYGTILDDATQLRKKNKKR